MSGKTILITRPKGDETALTEALHARGLRTIHEPLAEIFLNHTRRAELERALAADPDAVIVTSRYGVRALASLTGLRDPMIVAVGKSTADAALSCGFARVSAAGGNAQKLIEYVTDAYDSGSRFLYISAKQVRVDLEHALAGTGMQVERLVLYEAVAARALSDTLVEHLKRRQIDAVTFLSERAAEIFTQLLGKAGIGEAAGAMQACCLSETIAEALEPAGWAGIHIAAQPTLASMAECVDNALQPA